MNRLILPGPRTGQVNAPASKSQAHRLLICAALGKRPVRIVCDGLSRDIEATIACLRGLGAEIDVQADCIRVAPASGKTAGGERMLACGESGSTLRFLIPVTGALGVSCAFVREGRLPERPLEPLLGQLVARGMRFREESALLFCEGRLSPGDFTLPGDVSSQYVSGLLLALPLLEGDSTLTITGALQSAAYVRMTEQALSESGVRLEKAGDTYHVPGSQRFCLPERTRVEGDCSNAAFFLCMGALSDAGITVSGLNPASAQGDRAILDLLRAFGAEVTVEGGRAMVRKNRLVGCEIDAAPIPDLIPTLCALASVAEGETRVVNAARLRIKESDRLASTAQLLRGLGGQVEELPDGLVIRGVKALSGGAADSQNDHRIAMSAAVCACASAGPVEVLGAQCVEKSYPRFWDDLSRLKGEKV